VAGLGLAYSVEEGLDGVFGRLLGLKTSPIVVAPSLSLSADLRVLLAISIHLLYSASSNMTHIPQAFKTALPLTPSAALRPKEDGGVQAPQKR
jgi:hypothetical protein